MPSSSLQPALSNRFYIVNMIVYYACVSFAVCWLTFSSKRILFAFKRNGSKDVKRSQTALTTVSASDCFLGNYLHRQKKKSNVSHAVLPPPPPPPTPPLLWGCIYLSLLLSWMFDVWARLFSMIVLGVLYACVLFFLYFAPVQRKWACFTWKRALETRS